MLKVLLGNACSSIYGIPFREVGVYTQCYLQEISLFLLLLCAFEPSYKKCYLPLIGNKAKQRILRYKRSLELSCLVISEKLNNSYCILRSEENDVILEKGWSHFARKNRVGCKNKNLKHNFRKKHLHNSQ